MLFAVGRLFASERLFAALMDFTARPWLFATGEAICLWLGGCPSYLDRLDASMGGDGRRGTQDLTREDLPDSPSKAASDLLH